MKIGPKYKARLENYLQWEPCRTPLTSFGMSTSAADLPPVSEGGDITPAEWLFTFETHGKIAGPCSDLGLLGRYWWGKANRDWWFKEVGWFKKNAIFIPEEFLGFLTPLCFIELFGRAPIIELVRYYHDNGYSSLAFTMDNRIKSFLAGNTKMAYFERDDREPWHSVVWRMARLRYIEPAAWEAREKLFGQLKSSWSRRKKRSLT